MRKLLVVGASILQLPAILKAKEKGYFVATADRDPNAVGIPHADKFFQVSTIDVGGIYQTALDLGVDGIMTLATDMPMRAIAHATTKLGLPGISPETAETATDKGKMIKAFKSSGVAAPWFYVLQDQHDLDEVLDQISYPFIMKPVDNSGSRGVILVTEKSMLRDAYVYSRTQSRNGQVIIEEYLQGKEVSVETITFKGQTHVLAITDKITTGPPHFVELGHSQPSQLPVVQKEQIAELAKRAVDAVGIDIGPAHVEIMHTPDGPKMIELGARLGGDCITSHLVPLSTGIDMVGATIDCFTGYPPDIDQTIEKGSAICYITAPRGEIREINFIDRALRIPGVKEISLTKHVGDNSVELSSSNDRLGFVVAQGDSAAEANHICEMARVTIQVLIKDS